MRKVIFAIALIAASSASAKDLTAIFTDEDQATIYQALDSYVKAGGISVAPRAATLLAKLQAALTAAPAPSTGTPPK